MTKKTAKTAIEEAIRTAGEAVEKFNEGHTQPAPQRPGGEVIKFEAPSLAPDKLPSATMTAANLEYFLDEERKKRDLIRKYIRENLVDGVDYGRIGPSKKDCLLKPGSEKVCSLLHLRPTFELDHELAKIAGEGQIIYVCRLVNRHTGEDEGEGRGACSAKEKQGNFNTAVKIAMKRAQVDAVLRVAGLSDVFTQDLDDEPHKSDPAPAPARVPPPAPAHTRARTPEIDARIACPFGKNVGKKWRDMNDKELSWYENAAKKALSDPEKCAHFAIYEAAYDAIADEILARKSKLPDPDSEGDAIEHDGVPNFNEDKPLPL